MAVLDSWNETSPSMRTESDSALRSYWELGYHVELDVWTPAQCREIIEASETLSPYLERTFAPGIQPHRVHPVFLQAMRNQTIVAIMEKLVSGKVSGLQSVFYYGKPGTPGFNTHQDAAIVDTESGVFASAWSALQDTTMEMGGLVGYPGTHREPLLPTIDVNRDAGPSQDPNATLKEVVMPDGYHPLDLPVPQGSVVFLHGNFVHESLKNNSHTFRRALLLTYIRQGEKFRRGNTSQRSAINVY